MKRTGGGVYIYRTRKPGARLRIPVLSFHWGYVGETTSFYHRNQQHLYGLSNYGPTQPKPWADLVESYWCIPLPRWKWLLKFMETLLILGTWPVYNHKKNLWNPRRIPLDTAKKQRRTRDRGKKPFNFRVLHLVAVVLVAFMLLKIGGVL